MVFGKLLPESAPGIVLWIGSQADQTALRDDWVLVHELFHIGVPSFNREGKWFDEGLATYFEPIIRVRAGLYDAHSAWRDFALKCHARGARSRTKASTTRRTTRGILGRPRCIACRGRRCPTHPKAPRAETECDAYSRGVHGLEVWPWKNTYTADCASRSTPLPARSAFANAPSPFYPRLLRDLGVERKASGIALSDAAPLAWVRHAIFERGLPAASNVPGPVPKKTQH